MISKIGVTLLEFLIVLAFIGILIGVAFPISRNWHQRAMLDVAVQQFARDIDMQRSKVRRYNSPQTITATTGAASYQLGSATVDLPSGITFTQGASVTFSPPYGTTGAPVQTFVLALRAQPSLDRIIRVVGVTGKVVVKDE